MPRVCWTGANESFDDAEWRRRALIPAAGLEGMGWRTALRRDLDHGVDDLAAIVVDAEDADAEQLARRGAAAGAAVVVDVTRWLRREGGPLDPGWPRLRRLASAADALVAADPRSAERLESRLQRRVGAAADGRETPTSLRLAARIAGVDPPRTADRTAAALQAALHGPATSACVDAALGWAPLFDALLDRAGRVALDAPFRLLVFLDLIQDAELAMPIVRAVAARADVTVRVAMSRWLAEQAPSAVAALRAAGVEPEFVETEAAIRGKLPRLDGVQALLTPVATNLGAHAPANGVVQKAKVAGVPTFSLQHGVENVGLSYRDAIHTDAVEITSDYLFTWFPPDQLPAVAPQLRRKLLCVGLGKGAVTDPAALPLPAGDWRRRVGVFENLHWHRYGDAYRERFISDLAGCAAAEPDVLWILKPHHAGRWASKRADGGLPANVMVVDPTDAAWEPFTAPAILTAVDAVITTPSTVALDAVLAGKPVGVVGYELDLPMYEPLPILRSIADWRRMAAPGFEAGTAAQGFLRRTIVRSDAGEAILARLVEVARDGARLTGRRP